MAILICGGAGYIGSHVNKELHRQGYKTVVYDNLVYGHPEAVKWGKLIQADLADTEALNQVFFENRIDAVVHLAAYAYVGESVIEPEKYYWNNVYNTLNLLKAMRRHECRTVIFSSTCATYGIPDHVPISEDMPQRPINPYGATKLMVERIFRDYSNAYGLRFVVLRYFNAAGADPEGEIGESHDPETHIIPLVLDAASGRRPNICVFGTDYDTPDGSCIRDYIHVTDLADAHVLALRYLEGGRGSDFFNLGNARGTSVLEIIQTAQHITGKQIPVVFSERRPGDPPILTGCNEKAAHVLGWKPRFGEIDTIIAHAWNWHEHKRF